MAIFPGKLEGGPLNFQTPVIQVLQRILMGHGQTLHTYRVLWAQCWSLILTAITIYQGFYFWSRSFHGLNVFPVAQPTVSKLWRDGRQDACLILFQPLWEAPKEQWFSLH